MYAQRTQRSDCIASGRSERSPSTGAEETARLLGAREGYDHEPPSNDGEPVTIDASPPADTDGRTDADAALSSREVFA